MRGLVGAAHVYPVCVTGPAFREVSHQPGPPTVIADVRQPGPARRSGSTVDARIDHRPEQLVRARVGPQDADAMRVATRSSGG
jgi:hypothetical protein